MSLHDTIKIPIAVLKIGELRSIQTNLEFADVVTFRLIEGNGPVHILGQHSPVTYEVEDVEELAEEEILSDEEAVSIFLKIWFKLQCHPVTMPRNLVKLSGAAAWCLDIFVKLTVKLINLN